MELGAVNCLKEGIWRTKTGKYIPLKDMDFEHLENTMHMMMKKKMALSLGFDYEGKTEDAINFVDAWLMRLRGEWKQRIIEAEATNNVN